MYLVLNTKYLNQKCGIKKFYVARTLRIFPLYWVTLLSTILISIGAFTIGRGWGALEPFSENFNNLPAGTIILFIFSNIFILGQDAILFLGFTDNLGLSVNPRNTTGTDLFPYDFMLTPQMWSVSLELIFYSIAPFILGKNKIKLIISLFIFSLSLKIASVTLGYGNNLPWDYRFFPAELFCFLAGALSCYAYMNKQLVFIKKSLFYTLALLWSAIFMFYPTLHNANYVDILLIILLGFSLPTLFEKTKNSRLDATIGSLSYPIYLIHLLVIWVIQYGLSLSPIQTLLVAIPVTIAAASLLHFYLERPFDKYRNLLIQKKSQN